MLSLFFYFLSGAFKGASDDLMFHESPNHPKHPTNPNAWGAKYAKDNNENFIKLEKSPWYYLGLYKPAYKEKFMYSSTFLVSFSDPWHTYQFCQKTSMLIASILLWFSSFPEKWYNVGIMILFITGVFSLGFHTTYSWLLKSKQYDNTGTSS